MPNEETVKTVWVVRDTKRFIDSIWDNEDEAYNRYLELRRLAVGDSDRRNITYQPYGLNKPGGVCI